jgi:hypothetical protein
MDFLLKIHKNHKKPLPKYMVFSQDSKQLPTQQLAGKWLASQEGLCSIE